MRNAYKILFGKPERRRILERYIYRWEGNIKMDLKEIGCELDSSGLGWGTVAVYCEHGNKASGLFITRGEFLEHVSEC
jgi:hypothetical protein